MKTQKQKKETTELQEEENSFRIPFLAGATDLFNIAKRTAKNLAGTTSASEAEIRDRNLIVIVFAALAVEGFLNQLATLDWSNGDSLSLVHNDARLRSLRRVLTLAEEANAQPIVKLQLAYEVLGQQLDRGKQPFQDYALLKQLRDLIAHPKPSTVTIIPKNREVRSSRDKLLRALQSRGLLAADPSQSGRSLLDWLSSRTLASWAIQTTSEIILTTLAALPEGMFREATTLLFREFSLDEGRKKIREGP